MRIAYVDKDTGEISNIAHVGNSLHNFEEGTLINDKHYVRRLPAEVEKSETQNWVLSHFWNYTYEIWDTKPEKPGPFYAWTANYEWEFNRTFLLGYIRGYRARLLSGSDWTQTTDAPLTTEKKAGWATYRQALRDLPNNLPDTARDMPDVVWPTEPT